MKHNQTYEGDAPKANYNEWQLYIKSSKTSLDNLTSLEEFVDCYDMHQMKLFLLQIFLESSSMSDHFGLDQKECENLFGLFKFLEELDNQRYHEE